MTEYNPEVPLIWTIKGNLPLADLRYETSWQDTAEFTTFTENHYLGDELVKSSTHAYNRQPLEMVGEQASYEKFNLIDTLGVYHG